MALLENYSCNICASKATALLSLDSVPQLQNRFFPDREGANSFARGPTSFHWCENCYHISIQKQVDVIFDQHYDNSQLASPAMVTLFKSVVADINTRVPAKDSVIVELGCGRGEFLELLCDAGYTRLHGFDPAAPLATELVTNRYWGGAAEDTRADLIITRHMLEELPEPDPFIEHISRALNPGGRLYCEITNAPAILSPGGVFSLYPECVNLFSATSLSRLLCKNNFVVDSVNSLNDGKWLGVWASRRNQNYLRDTNKALGVTRVKLVGLPKPVVLWGAAGRGSNILSFLNLGLKEIEYVVDMNPAKQGLFIPPYGQKVISSEELAEIRPATVIVANSKYKDEVSIQVPADCTVIAIEDI